METDPRKLRPSELCRLLNSTPLGEVINDRQLRRHRTRAGLRIGDARHVDLVRYVAWLVHVRHDPKPQPDSRVVSRRANRMDPFLRRSETAGQTKRPAGDQSATQHRGRPAHAQKPALPAFREAPPAATKLAAIRRRPVPVPGRRIASPPPVPEAPSSNAHGADPVRSSAVGLPPLP